jgi:SWIM zinc finger
MSIAVESQREATRWQTALNRAIADALDVLIEPISGEAFVESGSNPGILYVVTAYTCSCPAGAKGIPCKHRACYLAMIDEMPLDPAPVIREIPVIECVDCCGCGIQDYGRYTLPCDVCDRRGVVAA